VGRGKRGLVSRCYLAKGRLNWGDKKDLKKKKEKKPK